ncbi:glycosyltransferase family 1 protein [Flammeovirgaceae bacterium SG7u.111]|nr:glycosyltransferase family 1 protein [Flammeovirgaceae bacterium SG7u.132]WPO34558.1 glycosyltransferase family 1 protein [Flammeovirgaceae bacterium SG7u.111]
MKNITMVSCQHFQSGIGHYGYELAKHISKKNGQVELYKPFKPNHPDQHYHQHKWIKPIHYRSFRQMHPYLLPLFIRNAIGKTSSDVYHAHWFMSGLALTYFVQKPVVVTMHDVSLLHVLEKGSRYQQYYHWAIERFRKRRIPLIVVSETARQDTIQYANYPQELVHAIPNGINFERFFPTQKKKANEKFTIVYAGGLGKRKNVGLLLKAFQQLEKKYSVQLRIAGAFPERTEYPNIAKELGLKNVEFTGYLPDEEMNAFYNQGDLMIYPSEYEGFGFAPLEAMAAGTPVLCAKGGALSEISGGGAMLLDYNVEDLVNKTSLLITNTDKRMELAERGKHWVKKYSWERCAMETTEVYQHVIR